jgi:hypothetical protein
MNSDKVVELKTNLMQQGEAKWIANLWTTWNNQRQTKMAEWRELKKFIFATDTTKTANHVLPWSNTTTTPKLCQIRDNLHSNYISAIFPNDKWLTWHAYSKDSAVREKSKIITAYMENKAREGGLREKISRLLLDYIDYGNCFAMASFESRYTLKDGQAYIPDYIGPTCERISPEDIVFNPLASNFKNTPKIIRSIKTLGELKKLAQTHPDYAFWEDVVTRRLSLQTNYGGTKAEDWGKASQYSIDGFGNLHEYYMSNYVEVLEFYGDTHNPETGELKTNRMITVVDRSIVARDIEISTYSGRAPIYHVGWRLRPDNLWAMGPLDNLVGMQYRIDHLENMKADAMDLLVIPPLKIKGEVEAFEWRPGAEIHVDENGDIGEVLKNLGGVIQADNQIEALEAKMEMYAGAPREAMGIRTPGEKTALEVQTLNSAAGRIFQEKTTNFEVTFLEPLLNGMLEQARRNMDETDIVRVIDTDLGVTQFKTITVDDLTAKGILRPVGARHFSQQAQDLQNLVGVANSPLWELVKPHTSGKAIMRFIEDIVSLNGYDMFRDNVGIMEQKESQQLIQQASENLQVEAGTPGIESIPKMSPEQAVAQGQGGGIFENIPA